MNFSTNKLSNILGMEIHDLDLKNIVEKSVKIELQKLVNNRDQWKKIVNI